MTNRVGDVHTEVDMDGHPGRWRILALLSMAEFLGMCVWFTANAVGPELQLRWTLSGAQLGWLTTSVQLGFVVGTAIAAILNLADIIPSRILFSSCAILGAGANALLLLVPGYSGALVARFLTGFFLAGVYPPGMKMIATWFKSARGLAIGTVVGALAVGKAFPYLLHALPQLGLNEVILGASCGALMGGILVFGLYRDGPFPFSRAPFSWGLVARVLRHRETRLSIGGYLGHMWELYAAWVMVYFFFIEYFGRASDGLAAGAAAAAMIACGGVGSVLGGGWADRWGRERITIWMMAMSGSCALVIGWTMDMTPWIVVPLAMLWGVTIVGDSAQFSAVLTEVTPSEAAGTALTLQTSMGFALTAISIQMTGWLSDTVGWGVAFSALAIGPVLGIIAMARLKRIREQGLGTE